MPMSFHIRTHMGARRVAARVDRTIGISRAIAQEARSDPAMPISIRKAVIKESWKVERSTALAFLSSLKTFYLQRADAKC